MQQTKYLKTHHLACNSVDYWYLIWQLLIDYENVRKFSDQASIHDAKMSGVVPKSWENNREINNIKICWLCIDYKKFGPFINPPIKPSY